MKSYIILIDGWYQIWNKKPDPKCFNKNARFFEIDPNLSAYSISIWMAANYDIASIREIKL